MNYINTINYMLPDIQDGGGLSGARGNSIVTPNGGGEEEQDDDDDSMHLHSVVTSAQMQDIASLASGDSSDGRGLISHHHHQQHIEMNLSDTVMACRPIINFNRNFNNNNSNVMMTRQQQQHHHHHSPDMQLLPQTVVGIPLNNSINDSSHLTVHTKTLDSISDNLALHNKQINSGGGGGILGSNNSSVIGGISNNSSINNNNRLNNNGNNISFISNNRHNNNSNSGVGGVQYPKLGLMSGGYPHPHHHTTIDGGGGEVMGGVGEGPMITLVDSEDLEGGVGGATLVHHVEEGGVRKGEEGRPDRAIITFITVFNNNRYI